MPTRILTELDANMTYRVSRQCLEDTYILNVIFLGNLLSVLLLLGWTGDLFRQGWLLPRVGRCVVNTPSAALGTDGLGSNAGASSCTSINDSEMKDGK